MTSVPLCFLDTETTGVHEDKRVWEIAMIRKCEGELTVRKSFFVDVNIDEADPFGLKVGGFYERHPYGIYLSQMLELLPKISDIKGDFVSELHAARLVAKFTHGAHLVGAVPNFDAEVLRDLMMEYGLFPSWHYHLIDVEALMVGYLAARQESVSLPWKSDDLSRLAGVEPPSESERHTAMGDARWAERIYDKVMST